MVKPRVVVATKLLVVALSACTSPPEKVAKPVQDDAGYPLVGNAGSKAPTR